VWELILGARQRVARGVNAALVLLHWQIGQRIRRDILGEMHELCHWVHGHHGSAFYALLSRAMPDWEQRKRRLAREGAEVGCQAAPCGGREQR
jgi:hypothetical protein